MVWWVVSQEFRHNIKSLIRCILKKCFSLYLNLKKPFMRNGVFLWMLQKVLHLYFAPLTLFGRSHGKR